MIERYGLENLLNKINSISPKNPIYEEAKRLGEEALRRVGW